MKAIVRREYGPPEVLALEERDRPVPGDDEVLIRARATSLNASDWEILTGRPAYGRIWGFFTPKIQVLGSDVAGVVEAVGATVSRLRPGDEVFGDIFGVWGGLAEWVCAPERMLRPKPQDLSFEEAAAIPQSAAIALQGLRGLEPGMHVLVNGAGGGGGSFAVQIARARGARVTAVDSAAKLELLRSLGADEVIDYAREDCTAGSGRYDLILDLVGRHALGDFRRALAPGGRYLLVGGSVSLLLRVLTLGSLSSLLTSRTMGLLPLKNNEGLDEVLELCASGAVRPVVDETFPLAETPRAMGQLGEGRANGKLVVTMEGEG